MEANLQRTLQQDLIAREFEKKVGRNVFEMAKKGIKKKVSEFSLVSTLNLRPRIQLA